MWTPRNVPRPTPLQHGMNPSNVLGPAGSCSLRSRHRLQMRAFRFGMWPFFVDSTGHRQVRRRTRALKSIYADGDRRWAWYGDALAEDPHHAIKRVVAKYWASTTSGGNDGRCSRAREADYVIDPISNRKVFKRDVESVELENRSEFSPFITPNTDQECPPIHSNGRPPVSELSKYADPKLDDWTATEVDSQSGSSEPSVHADASRYVFDSSVLKSEEYALNHLPPDDPVEEEGDGHDSQARSPVPKGSPESTDSHVSSTPAEILKENGDVSSPQDVLGSSSLQSELERYGSHIFEDAAIIDEPSGHPKDLDQYRPASFDDVKDEDRPFQKYGDLEKYRALAYQDSESTSTPEHDVTSESLKEYDIKEQNEIIPETTDARSSSVSGKLPKMELPEGHIFSKHYAEAGVFDAAASPRDGARSREELQQRMEDLSRSSDAIDEQVNLHIKRIREEAHMAGPDGRLGNLKIQPALNRRAATVRGQRLHSALGADLYSKEPQGLETSFAEECGGRQTMPLYTRAYGSEPGQVPPRSQQAVEVEGQAQGSHSRHSIDTYYGRDPGIDGIPPLVPKDPKKAHLPVQSDEPTVYKILIYDENTQTVNTVETTSVVPDGTTPLTPTEVLPRLSCPAKFLPHFAPLLAEGFEVASGKADVLVFRQVRPAKAADRVGNAPPINPIDMMGRPPAAALPNAAAFVSPTGFVNYDVPLMEEEHSSSSAAKTEPAAFRSNINVHREEPVFSGPKTDCRRKDGKRSKVVGVGRRMVFGGAWVAGVFYALGVITEYFLTGGADGAGPTGI